MAKQKKPRLTKEDLDARFTAQQEKNRARRETKVTREDVEKRLAERKAERAGKKKLPGQRSRAVSLGIGIVLLVGSGALATTTLTSTEAFNAQTLENEQKIASAQGVLNEIPAADEGAATQYAAELEEQIAAATVKGEEVAELQQEFANILFRGNTEPISNGAPGPAITDSVEHRKLLAPYFVDRALFVEDELAYAPGSVLPFEENEIDPRFPWYVAYEPGTQGRVVTDPSRSSWELTSVVATGTAGVLEATWLNQSPTTDDLFAWATASYYVDPGAFGSLTVGLTTLGERGVPTMNKDGE